MIRNLFLVFILICVGFGVLIQALSELSEKAMKGDVQATFLIPALVFGTLILLGIGGWAWTAKTGRMPE